MNDMNERIKLTREKEKEVRDMWQRLCFSRDLKYLLEEPEFDYKEYFREVLEGLIFIGFMVGLFFVLWFLLP